MSSALGYTSLRARLRVSVNHRETILGWLRMARYALVQGPWRPWIVRYYAARNDNPTLPVRADSLVPSLDAGAATHALTHDARSERFELPGPLIDEIVTWSKATRAKRIDDAHVDCEAVQRIALDPRLVAVARGYLGAEPILFTSKIYWTIPPADPEGRLLAAAEQGQFHYDLADVRAVTLFVYLTPVDEECGPHVVIPGTQRRVTPGQIMRRTITEEFAQKHYGGRMEVITGPRGTSWFEDITCYHKQAAGSKVRLMLSIIYSLHRRPLENLEMRPKSGNDSRPADRMNGGVRTQSTFVVPVES